LDSATFSTAITEVIGQGQGPGRRRSRLRRLPQIRTCPIEASGSSRHGFTSRFAICERYVDPRPRYKAPDGWPAHKSMTNISLPSPGSPRSRFPCFNGTMKMCDSLRPSRRASLCFAWQYQVLRLWFAPCGPGRKTAGLGFAIRSPFRQIAPGDDQGLPSSWGAFVCLCHVLLPRRDRTHQAIAVCRRGPRAVQAEGSPRVVLSRLHSTALALAVYASQWSLLAPTQDSLPTAGQALPGGIDYPQGSNERFQTVVILPSQASWRKDSTTRMSVEIEF